MTPLQTITTEALRDFDEIFNSVVKEDERRDCPWCEFKPGKFRPGKSLVRHMSAMHPKEYLTKEERLKTLFSHHLSKAYEKGVEETIKFMKGKIISMPVGSNPPLVMPEALVRNFLLSPPKKTKEEI